MNSCNKEEDQFSSSGVFFLVAMDEAPCDETIRQHYVIETRITNDNKKDSN